MDTNQSISSEKEALHISAFGICVSRDIIEFAKSKERNIIVDKFVQDVPPIAALCKPFINMNYDELKEKYLTESPISNFRKRCFALGVTGMAFDFFFEKISEWLILDMGRSIFNLLNKDECYISDTDTYNELLNLCCTKLGIEIPKKTIDDDMQINALNEKYLADYFDTFLKHYDKSRIILLEVYPAEYYIDSEGLVKNFNHQSVIHHRNRIRYSFNLAREYLKGCHVIEFPEYVLADINHRWGGVHSTLILIIMNMVIKLSTLFLKTTILKKNKRSYTF